MSAIPPKCMFDANVFNRILDGRILLEWLNRRAVAYATHIQRDELQKTSNTARREALMQVFHDAMTTSRETESVAMDASKLDEAKVYENRMMPTCSGVWGTSKWGAFMWSGEESLVPVVRAELDLKNAKANNVQDALIADTAIRADYILVTDDRNLAKVTKKYGGRCLSVKELLEQLSQPPDGGIDGTQR
jgi:predicted nucleic acid-binding protein